LQAVEFILQNWSPRDTGQVALKFGTLLLPIAFWRWVPALRRRHNGLVVAFGVATGLLFLVFAWIQIVKGDVTATLNGWDDAHFAIEIAGYQFAFAAVCAWTFARRQHEALAGATFGAALCLALSAAGMLFGWGGPYPRLAQLGLWGLGVGVALLASAALGRAAWLRALLASAALYLGWAALVHLYGWLVAGELSMGNVGPSLWHDLAFPLVALWVLRRS
jgi:uncharacterized protein DUF6790